MTLSDFSQLKKQFISTVATSDSHSNLLHSLKELFKEDINSVRRFEKINTVGQLLHVLELRGLLSEDNIEPLKNIAKKINNNDLLAKVNQYEDSHIPREHGNYYESENANRSLSTEIFLSSSPIESSIKKKKDRIILTVAQEIGTYWKDLARSLKIREYAIDEIDHNHRTLASKAMKIMETFDVMADKKKWFFVLCDSLNKIHRKDLALTIQEIMLMSM